MMIFDYVGLILIILMQTRGEGDKYLVGILFY